MQLQTIPVEVWIFLALMVFIGFIYLHPLIIFMYMGAIADFFNIETTTYDGVTTIGSFLVITISILQIAFLSIFLGTIYRVVNGIQLGTLTKIGWGAMTATVGVFAILFISQPCTDFISVCITPEKAIEFAEEYGPHYQEFLEAYPDSTVSYEGDNRGGVVLLQNEKAELRIEIASQGNIELFGVHLLCSDGRVFVDDPAQAPPDGETNIDISQAIEEKLCG